MTEATPAIPAAGPDRTPAPAGWHPHIVALVCNWCSYAGADMAGTTRLQYPASVRLVRFPCTGRMNPLMVLKAFEHGADGVLISGCHPGDCHYVHGNLFARRRFAVLRSLLGFLGVDLRRLHVAWVSAAEGGKWARLVDRVTASVREAGPWPGFGESPEAPPVELPTTPVGTGAEPTDEEAELLRNQLRRTAAELLESERVEMVIGYRRGALADRMVPVMVTAPEEAATLEWNRGCLNNLAAYLPVAPERHPRVAVVAKRCDAAAIVGLVREGQLERDRLVVVGAPCPGVRVGDGPATKCLSCTGEPHPSCDVVVALDGAGDGRAEAPNPTLEAEDPRDRELAHLEALDVTQRWWYWQRQFARCLRCYACRAVCPLCYCSSCISEKHRPQWVTPAITSRGNWMWNVIRALHLAGRCTGCDECARVCPAGVRLDLINRKLALEVARQFGGAGDDSDAPAALATFRIDDPEEFIL